MRCLPHRICSTLLSAVGCAMLLAHFQMAHAQDQMQIEAYAGSPFGVCRMTVPLERDETTTLGTNAYVLEERNDRALYPAFTTGRLMNLVRGILGRGDGLRGPRRLTVLFLFTGEEPLDLTLQAPTRFTATITPRSDPNQSFRLLQRWWREYHGALREQESMGDYPAIVETYLTGMLGRRLQLAPPLLSRNAPRESSQIQQSLDLLLGTEKLRAEIMRETLSGVAPAAALTNVGIPFGIQPVPLHIPPQDGDVQVEPIAMHVPEECFYVRFGEFSNYLWATHLMEDYGGDLSGMITLRGHNAHFNQRVQRQIALKENVLGELLGDQVIADVALIGRDTYLAEGASIGILFQAKIAPLLAADITKQRAAALARERAAGAELQNVSIAGRDVSFLSTPDNRLRSFYAVDGDFHLVTTSSTIVERFFAAGAGDRPLGDSAEFRHARTMMPIQRNDTLFVYLSTSFFNGLLTPQYRIELRRRLLSITDIELVQMAQLAGRAEGRPAENIDDLIRAGLLPPTFGQHADGSTLLTNGDEITDSIRGARGTFLPVADTEIVSVTHREAAEYREFMEYYDSTWRQMDPLMIGIKRYALKDRPSDNPDGIDPDDSDPPSPSQELERITIDARVAPFAADKYGWFVSLLGPPQNSYVAPLPEDVIHVQAFLDGGIISPSIQPHFGFVGVQDIEPGLVLAGSGLFRTLRLVMATPGYLGAWPWPGWLQRLPFGLVPPPDEFGYSRLLFGLWRREWGSFAALSFQRPILDSVLPRLRVVNSEYPAQLRVRVRDLSRSKLSSLVDVMTYSRALQASIGNARFMHALSQQLGVPREQARLTAERLLGEDLVCSLDGEYQLLENDRGIQQWTSTAWSDQPGGRVPTDYESPLLSWFRGLEADLTLEGDQIIAHAQLDMQRKPTDKTFGIPLLNLFGFGDKKPAAEPSAEEIPATPASPDDEPASPNTPREF